LSYIYYSEAGLIVKKANGGLNIYKVLGSKFCDVRECPDFGICYILVTKRKDKTYRIF